MSVRAFLICLCSLLVPLSVKAFEVDSGPVHEAFITRDAGELVLQAVPKAPPASLVEKAPPSNATDLQWIDGYWRWNADDQGFVWVSGVWRRSPPDHLWVPGLWKEIDGNWVWIQGFWSPVQLTRLVFNQTAPPDPVEEEASQPPGDDYFWVPGNWEFVNANQRYEWTAGYWEQLDPEWVLVSSHYVWRPEGYALIEAYWDFPIQDRGQAYSPVKVGTKELSSVYQPVEEVAPIEVVERIFYDYPNYSCFFQHHYYYHRSFWDGWWGTPPWWEAPVWWTFTWGHQWGLWWWYTHPGYPQPHWLHSQMSRRMRLPSARLLRRAKRARGPVIVTKRGVVPRSRIRDSIRDVTDSKRPIIPVGRRRKEIERRLRPRASEGPLLRPSGSRSEGARGLERPTFPRDRRSIPTRRASVPQKPRGGRGIGRGSRQTPRIPAPEDGRRRAPVTRSIPRAPDIPRTPSSVPRPRPDASRPRIVPAPRQPRPSRTPARPSTRRRRGQASRPPQTRRTPQQRPGRRRTPTQTRPQTRPIAPRRRMRPSQEQSSPRRSPTAPRATTAPRRQARPSRGQTVSPRSPRQTQAAPRSTTAPRAQPRASRRGAPSRSVSRAPRQRSQGRSMRQVRPSRPSRTPSGGRGRRG